MGIAGAKMAKIYNDVTDVFVDIRLISKDSGYEKKGLFDTDLDGNKVWYEDEANLVIAFFDDADLAQIDLWQRNHTRLKVVVIGIDDYIFWYRPSTIVLTEPGEFDPGRRNIRVLRMGARGSDLNINRIPGYEIYDVVDSNRDVLGGFVSTDFDFSDGSTVMNLLPASFGAEGTTSWTIAGTTYNFNTIILNTQD